MTPQQVMALLILIAKYEMTIATLSGRITELEAAARPDGT